MNFMHHQCMMTAAGSPPNGSSSEPGLSPDHHNGWWMAYVLSDVQVPSGVKAHSTRAVTTSWASQRGASLAT